MGKSMEIFEQITEENEADRNYEIEQENCIEFLKDSKMATLTLTKVRLIHEVERLAEKFPDEVEICYRNKNRNGNVVSIVAKIPVSYIKFRPKRVMTDEAREALAERFRHNVLDDNSRDEMD